MKTTRTTITELMIIVLCCWFSLMWGCSSNSSTATAPTDSGLSAQDLFYATMQDTTPVYSTISASALQAGVSAAAGRSLPAAWGDDTTNMLYKVFFTLREFDSATDEGVVDRSNLYKLLYDAESVLTGSYDSAVELTEATQIASPFAGIDTSASTFSNAANIEDDALSIAYNDTDTALEALMTWKWTDEGNPDKAERGIAYYVLNKSTHDVSIDMTYSVDYDIASPETEYNLRCRASGNTADHSFQFNYLIGTTGIIAKGVSQGDGNYVIFKYKDISSVDPAAYLRVPAEEGESFFEAYYEAGTTVTDGSTLDDAEDYLAWVDAQDFMTESDLVTSTDDLNVGIADYAGTINLVY